MQSVLDMPVSIFKNIDLKPVEGSLWDDALNRTPNEDALAKVRAELDEKKQREMKAKTLSAFTISCTVNPDYSPKELTGLISLDFDLKHNLHIANWHQVKSILSTAPFAAYVRVSAGGKGCYMIVPVEDPQQHAGYFRALSQLFKNIGLNVDQSGQNINRMRFESYDPAPYVNHNAAVFKVTLQEPVRRIRRRSEQDPGIAKIWVETAVEEICFREIDLTDTYEKWLHIGFALAAQFDEDGRDYFHQISQFHPYYSYDACDQQYDRCLNRDHSGKITIATFYDLCAQADVRIKDLLAAADFK